MAMSAESKSLSKGGLYYLVYNILNMAFPFISGIYVARILSPGNIGRVSAAQNLCQYFVILSFLGIPTYGLREIAKTRANQKERNQVFSELFIINLASTIIFLLLYLVLILCVPKYRMDLPLYLVVGISIAFNALNISWLYEGLEKFGFVAIRNLICKTVAFVCLVALVRNPDNYLRYALINVIGTGGNYIINMLYSPRFVHFSLQDIQLQRHVKPILFLVAVNLAIELYSLMDITMMNFWCNTESIAYYRYGHTMQKVLLQIISTFTMVLVPRISYYFAKGEQTLFNHLVSKAFKLIIISSLPMIFGIYFTSDFLIVQLYGERYIASVNILKWFSILLLVSPIGYLLGSRILLVTNHENKMLICVSIGAAINLLGNALLIPRYAELGATMASILSEIIVMVIYVSFGKRYFTLIGAWNTIGKVLISSLIMGLFLFFCCLSGMTGWVLWFVQVAGAVLLYAVLLIVLKEEIARDYFLFAIKKLTFHESH